MSGPIKTSFEVAAAHHIAKPKRPAPFSIRLSDEERAFLERKAGSKPLGTYAREKLLDGAQTPRKTIPRKPKVDYELLGRILGLLGECELTSLICLLAVAAESGSVVLDEEANVQVKEACTDIQEIRLILIKALGLRP